MSVIGHVWAMSLVIADLSSKCQRSGATANVTPPPLAHLVCMYTSGIYRGFHTILQDEHSMLSLPRIRVCATE